MALVTLPTPIFWGTPLWLTTSNEAVTLDATGEYTAWIMRAPKTGTIDRLHFRANTITADGDGLRCRIETVDAATGLPSGTLWSGSSEVTIATTTASSWNRSGAGLAAAVTKNDWIAVLLMSPASGTTFNGNLNYGWRTAGAMPVGGALFGYSVQAIPTATKYGGTAQFVNSVILEYNDGTTPFLPGVFPYNTNTSRSFNSGSTPDERAALFTIPFGCRVVGLEGYVDSDEATDLVLYSGTTSLGSISLDKDIRMSTAIHHQAGLLATAVELTKDASYRFSYKPTTTTNITIYEHAIDTAIGGTRLRECAFGSGQSVKMSTRSDAGSWSDTDDAHYSFGLWIDQIDLGDASAAGIPASSFMNGVLQQ